MNIRFLKKIIGFLNFVSSIHETFSRLSTLLKINVSYFFSQIQGVFLSGLVVVLSALIIGYSFRAFSSEMALPVQACVVVREADLTNALRGQLAHCLGWASDSGPSLCLGSYKTRAVTPLVHPDEVNIFADQGLFYSDKPSVLKGHVEVQQMQRVVNAQTAYLYRDTASGKITKIEFLGDVHYMEPGILMIASQAVVNPQDKSGETKDVLYRLNSNRHNAALPAWGRASLVKRFANKDYLLRQSTYTTCAPQDKAWDIEAQSITVSDAKAIGVARHARLRIHELPVFYAPYLSFPTTKDRKSGFLMPMVGYSDVGGFDFGLPYYWNIAPNYDATIIPHLYTERGLMLGGEFRYLSRNSTGIINGSFLPDDKAYAHFLQDNDGFFPELQDNSTNRWSIGVLESMWLSSNVQFNINAQQVSDDYYLQDFNTNLALLTQRQLLRQADVTYTSDHWILRAMGQSYQTLHPVNEMPVSPVYERLPQLMAHGFYELPFHLNLNLLGQYDQFHWPNGRRDALNIRMPQGPRAHFNPIVTMPLVQPWGYLTPSLQWVDTYYQVQNQWEIPNADYNRSLSRLSLDSGLYFERNLNLLGGSYIQTLEPRLFYLQVPFQNQTVMPVYDSGYMIFNMDQLFRTNRFSGFDRIGDANQLSYAVTSRWLSEQTGTERATFSIGQIKYFSNRKVELCQSMTGYCVQDPNAFGYLSSVSETSPVASRALYHFNALIGITGDYVWDPATHSTNNADLMLHYQPDLNQVISAGYSYLVNGDVTQVRGDGSVDNALHQALFAMAWPVSDRWSAVGAYSHNISKNYSMMSLLGFQYDSCCWAMRVLGGRAFKSLNAAFEPQYNDNIYLQFQLKGLGTVANSDPYSILSTYIPGYNDIFHR